jgi:hypothetical protein
VNDLRNLLDAEGRVMRWPSKVLQKTAVLEYLATKFDLDRTYNELEVNAILKAWHVFSDWALLRRELFERGLLDRTPNGSSYTRVFVASGNPNDEPLPETTDL